MNKYDVYKRGRKLADKYGCDDWSIVVDTSASKRVKRRLGYCDYRKKQIVVYQWWLETLGDDDGSDLDALLLHELAHALEPDAGHRVRWQRRFADLLWQHWNSEFLLWHYLHNDRYCKRRIEQLAAEATKMQAVVEKPSSAKGRGGWVASAAIDSPILDSFRKG